VDFTGLNEVVRKGSPRRSGTALFSRAQFSSEAGSPSKGSAPVGLTLPIHDRMPVILDPDGYDLWLDPGMRDVAAASDLLMPYDAQLMRCYPVSTRIQPCGERRRIPVMWECVIFVAEACSSPIPLLFRVLPQLLPEHRARRPCLPNLSSKQDLSHAQTALRS
jgi:SOS response associated peptidase (SRAP)